MDVPWIQTSRRVQPFAPSALTVDLKLPNPRSTVLENRRCTEHAKCADAANGIVLQHVRVPGMGPTRRNKCRSFYGGVTLDYHWSEP